MKEKATVFSSPLCAPCERLKEYLRARGVEFIVRDVMVDEEAALFLESRNLRSTPVLMLDGELITGFQRERIEQLLNARPDRP
jgi:glutaredoxin